MSTDEEKEAQWRKQRGWPAHSYYCSKNNFLASSDRCPTTWNSWSAFFAEFKDADQDMNFVFRFDWEPALPDYNGNNTEVLLVFMMHQRKGLFHCHYISVEQADEVEIKEWLAKQWGYIVKLWTPIAPTQESLGL